MKPKLHCILTFILVGVLALPSSSQTSPQYTQSTKVQTNWPALGMKQLALSSLMKTVSLNVVNTPLEEVISMIAKRGEVRISYSNATLPANKPVSLSLADATVAEALLTALQGTGVDFSVGATGQVVLMPRARAKEETGTITGKVTDARTQQPLPGANVVIEGTSLGASADAEGNFSIERVPPGSYKLRASVIGYKSSVQEIIVVAGQQVTIDFLLEEGAIGLDEIVVIGYGTTTKRFNTSSISTVAAEDIVKQPVNNPLLALQGRTPGVVITQNTGLPGGAVEVKIQGRNSIAFNVSNDPLYVIDGVPYMSRSIWTLSRVQGDPGNSPNFGTTGFVSGSVNPMSFINSGDIERIDILKDADATAIYGSRAANGAILITTKKGRMGETKADINVQNGWGTVSRRMDLLNTRQYLEMRREAISNDGLTVGSLDPDLNGTWDTTRSIDWQKELIGGTAQHSDVQTTVTGGNVNTQFLAAAGYRRETTVFPGDFTDQKGSVRLNISNTSLDQRFRLQLSGGYLVEDNRLSGKDLTQGAMQLPPVAPALRNADGTLNSAPDSAGNPTWHNPLEILSERFSQKTNNLIANGSVSYIFFPGLEVKSSFGYNDLKSKENLLSPFASINPQNRTQLQRSSSFSNGNTSTWIVEPQVSYKTLVAGAEFESLIGTTLQQTNSIRESAYGEGYVNDLDLENIGSAPTKFAQRNVSSYKYNALFGRIKFNWEGKYILNLTGRRDGSSRFGPQNRFHNFGSIGGAWIFSNEDFIRESVPFLSFGKLRANYGTTGNDQIGDYQFLSLYTNFSTPLPYQATVGLQPNKLPNPYLQWEETQKLQFGLDLGFLEDRIIFEANYYRNQTSNQLLSYALPITTGFTGIQNNFPATVQNFGWEFTVNTTNIRSEDFLWSTNINLTIPNNKLVDFPDLASSSYANQLVIGEPITVAKVLQFAGVNPSTGLYQFLDKDGNLTSSPNFSTDRTKLINTDPSFYGGFYNSFRYGGFQLDALFQFVKQVGYNYLYGPQVAGWFYGQSNIGNQPVYVMQRWRRPGDATSIQKFQSLWGDFSAFFPRLYAVSSDAAYSDASYIRLKNLSLSWQLPLEWRQGLQVQSARIYVQGQNLLTFTNYKGLDPETRNTLTLPPLRVWTFGLQITP